MHMPPNRCNNSERCLTDKNQSEYGLPVRNEKGGLNEIVLAFSQEDCDTFFAGFVATDPLAVDDVEELYRAHVSRTS